MVKVASFLIVFLLGLSLVSADVSDVCTSTGTQPSGPSYTIPDTPANVLYVVITVDIVNTAYNNDMLTGYNLLKSAVAALNNTSTSRLHYLAPKNPITFDLNQFDQIWVVDLSSNPDNEADKVRGYKAIADWWKAKGQPHIICDARWISSVWTYSQTVGGSTKIFGYDLNQGRPNYKLVENYFYNLLIRGGGLFLGTDHAPAFVSGINDILTQIGLDPFTNFYYEYPYLLEVDDASGVLSWPNDPTHHWRTVNGTLHKYLWDDSSTGFAPYNVQPNGLIFYPMGWHGNTGSGKPGISTTIRGSTGFLISIDTPACNEVFAAGTSVSFSATAVQQGTAPYTWTWTSDLDGVIGSSASFSKSLSVGIHRVTVRAVDSQKLTAEAKVQVEVGLQHGTSAMCYLARYNNKPDAFEIFALKRNVTATNYYSLGKPVAGSSNTADSLEEANNGEFFFYDDGTTTSLVHIFGAKNGQTTTSTVNVKFSGSALQGVTAPVQDFDTTNSFSLSGTSGAAAVSASKNTAGWVLSGFPRDSTYCVHYNFAGLSNLNQYVVRSHSADSNTVPNTNPIIAWRNKASSVPALDLCYAKCRCDATQTLTALSDTFNTGILLDPVTGDKANYFPNTACSWLIKPQSPTGDAIWGIALYFTSMSLGTGDSVSVYSGSDSTGTLIGTYTGTTLPGTIRVDGPGPVFVQFNSDSDASVGLGFTATYSVIPQLLAVTPNNIPSKAKTVVTVTGANFYSSALLACQFDKTVVAAKYVDSKTITCVAPMHQLGLYNFEVSNDGVSFTWTWADSPHGVVGVTWRGYKCYDGR